MIYRIFVLITFLGCLGCSSSPSEGKNDEPKRANAKNKKAPKEIEAKPPFQFRETIAKGTDTGDCKNRCKTAR